ncbi:VOC family protein [Knoellia sp. S7-12]|uniref:VOC family protein n=1 Tax=Knoellia sp. S7-12 TaxID=3126698 RepID=UPI0033697C26
MPLDLVTLVVDDYDEALRFFTEALDFEVAEDVPSLTTDGRPKRWVVVRPRDGGAGILLARADGERQERIVGDQWAGRVGLFLRVTDLDRTLGRAVEAGCAVIRPRRHEAYGEVVVVRDPWGNHWDLLGPQEV